MPIKWKLQDFFVADFLSHLVETETELSLSHVVVVGSDQHLQVGKGPVVGCSKVSIASIASWMDDGPMGFARMILLEDLGQ
jgi:hypothetical protein